jgi:uncharacterized OsmC-like protein
MSMHPVATAAADETDAHWSRMAIRTLARLAGFAPGATDAIRTTTTSQLKQLETDMNVQTEVKAVDNGVNVEALLGARAALTETPAAGQFKWRARCDWVDGVNTRSRVEGFFGLGEEQARNASFFIDADHPEQFAAGNKGATPVEILLSALASCLTAGVAAVAQHRGIQLHKVAATVEGDMDLAGILGIDADVRNGFSAIRVTFDIEADASKDEIAAVVAQSQKRSAVFDIITNPGNVKVSVS